MVSLVIIIIWHGNNVHIHMRIDSNVYNIEITTYFNYLKFYLGFCNAPFYNPW